MTRRGELYRHDDRSGVSGTGVVAEVAAFSNGKVAVGWLGDHPSAAVWDSIDSVLAIHGHHGATVIRWEDGEVQTGPEEAPCVGVST